MPFALIFVAVALIVSGFRGTHRCLFTLLTEDASGKFLAWGAAMLVIGGLGYVKPLEPVSNALLVLLIVVLFLANGGVFTQASSAVTGAANVNSTLANVVQPQSANTVSSQQQLSPLAAGAADLAASGIM